MNNRVVWFCQRTDSWGNPREYHTHGFQVPTAHAHGQSNVVVNSVASRWIKASTNKTSNLWEERTVERERERERERAAATARGGDERKPPPDLPLRNGLQYSPVTSFAKDMWTIYSCNLVTTQPNHWTPSVLHIFDSWSLVYPKATKVVAYINNMTLDAGRSAVKNVQNRGLYKWYTITSLTTGTTCCFKSQFVLRIKAISSVLKGERGRSWSSAELDGMDTHVLYN